MAARVSYLELVLLSLGSRAGVEQINGENLAKILSASHSNLETRI